MDEWRWTWGDYVGRRLAAMLTAVHATRRADHDDTWSLDGLLEWELSLGQDDGETGARLEIHGLPGRWTRDPGSGQQRWVPSVAVAISADAVGNWVRKLDVPRLGVLPEAYARGEMVHGAFPKTSAGNLAAHLMPQHRGTLPWTTASGTALFTVALDPLER